MASKFDRESFVFNPFLVKDSKNLNQNEVDTKVNFFSIYFFF